MPIAVIEISTRDSVQGLRREIYQRMSEGGDGRKIKLIPDYFSTDFSPFNKMVCSESKQMHLLLILFIVAALWLISLLSDDH